MPSENIVSRFTTKSGLEAIIRYPVASDAQLLTDFINEFSLGDTFTRFSGEQFGLEEERKYLESEIDLIEKGECVKLFCMVDQKLAGICDIHRDNSLLTRKRHTGNLGLIIASQFRGQGIGKQLMSTTMSQAAEHISGLKMIKLDCFASNLPAISLYKKLGFATVGTIPKSLLHKGELIDEVIMIKEVSQ